VYAFLISFGAALAVGVGGALLGWWGTVGGILLGFLAFVVAWVVIGLRLRKRIAPAMERVQRQVQSGMLPAAMESLEGMLPLARWLPLLRGVIRAQMGVLAHASGDEQRALALLAQASRRNGDAQLLRAAIHYRTGDRAAAMRVLDVAAITCKKHVLLANAHAWLLHKEDRTDDAMARLNRLLKKDPTSAPTKDNLLRLQNAQRMSMKSFEANWYALGLEQPPAGMGQMRTGRKGFRQPPKRKRGG
jgi:tetratricopeptide (TPR) repeat protein